MSKTMGKVINKKIIAIGEMSQAIYLKPASFKMETAFITCHTTTVKTETIPTSKVIFLPLFMTNLLDNIMF